MNNLRQLSKEEKCVQREIASMSFTNRQNSITCSRQQGCQEVNFNSFLQTVAETTTSLHLGQLRHRSTASSQVLITSMLLPFPTQTFGIRKIQRTQNQLFKMSSSVKKFRLFHVNLKSFDESLAQKSDIGDQNQVNYN